MIHGRPEQPPPQRRNSVWPSLGTIDRATLGPRQLLCRLIRVEEKPFEQALSPRHEVKNPEEFSPLFPVPAFSRTDS